MRTVRTTGRATARLSRPGLSRANRRTTVRRWGAHPRAASAARSGAVGLGEVDQRRLDPAADLLGLAQPELQEDRVDVLLDCALREHELVGDRLVAVAARDEGEDLRLARRQLGELRALRARARRD